MELFNAISLTRTILLETIRLSFIISSMFLKKILMMYATALTQCKVIKFFSLLKINIPCFLAIFQKCDLNQLVSSSLSINWYLTH